MSYYAVVSPGLEKLARSELLEKFPGTDVQLRHGGLDIDVSLQDGLVFNHGLKIPTRFLYRLFSGRVRDLPKLFKKFKNFDWRPYYVQAPNKDNIHVSARASRLFDERKISAAVIDGINDFFVGTQAKKVDIERITPLLGTHEPALYLRFEEDQLTVSIDTSGERLDRRGKRTWVGLAPLRETYAYACLYALSKKINETAILCDPMSGSGVFAREALDWSVPNSERQFSYQAFPCVKNISIPLGTTMPWREIIALESDDKTFNALKHNLDNGAKIIKANALESSEIPNDTVMIANPPYGVRLKLDNPEAFLNHVATKLLSYHPKALALLVPREIKFNQPHQNLLEFSNGGIAVKLVYFAK